MHGMKGHANLYKDMKERSAVEGKKSNGPEDRKYRTNYGDNNDTANASSEPGALFASTK